MKNVAIMTDSNSGITRAWAERMDVFLLPMPFVIGDETYYEGLDLTRELFFEKLAAGENVSTSQPLLGDVTELWEKILTTGYDELVYIPMSSGLSTSYQSAAAISAEAPDKIFVVNNQRISVTQKQSVIDAIYLKRAGKNAAEIKEILERDAFESSIYITVDTLQHLKKGGRVTPAAAAIGTVLNIKPVLTIQGEKLDAVSKVRGMKAGRRVMIDALKKDVETRFAALKESGRLSLFIAWSDVKDSIVEEWRQEVAEAFSDMDVICEPLTLSVSCHIGPGALGIAVAKREGEWLC